MTITIKKALAIKLYKNFYVLDEVTGAGGCFSVEEASGFDVDGLSGISIKCTAADDCWPFWRFDYIARGCDKRWLEGFAYYSGPASERFWEFVSSGHFYDSSVDKLVRFNKSKGDSVLEDLYRMTFDEAGKSVCPVMYIGAPDDRNCHRLAKRVYQGGRQGLDSFLDLLEIFSAALVFNLTTPFSFVFCSKQSLKAAQDLYRTM